MSEQTEDGPRRIAELEMRITYQERSIEQLSTQAFDQERRIERLEKLLRDMALKLKEMAGDGPPLPPNERPPHY
jgi:SlyX protein